MLLYKGGLSGAISARHIECDKNFAFSKYTTYGLGGGAINAYFPKTIWEAKCVYEMLVECGEPFKIIGCGSNILADDKDFCGNVICMRRMKGIISLGKGRLLCLAGTRIHSLLNYCRNNQLGGLEYLYGIPASVGGAAFMNAGVGETCIGNEIDKVILYDGKLRILSHENCKFAYRHSTMRDINAVILAIIVNTYNLSTEAIDDRITYYKNKRSHLPKGKSCGCVFKNPVGTSAGYLIEKAGLKGLRRGGAYISEKHANFIINENGTSADVKSLIETVKLRVKEEFGVLLAEEVVYIGEFNETDC